MALCNKQQWKYHTRCLWTLLVSCAVCIVPAPAPALDEFFDKMLSVTDQELEKTSEKTSPEKPDEGTNPALRAVPPPQPLPTTPNIITPLPPQQPTQHSGTAEQPGVEILLEEPPVQDEALQKTGEVSENPAPPSSAADNEKLIEKMLKENPGVEGKATTQPQEETPSVATTPAPQQPTALPEVKKTLSEEAATIPKTLPEPPLQLREEAQNAKTAPSVDSWVGSIMFAPDEYQKLSQSISVYERITGRRESTSGTKTTTAATPSTTSAGLTPAFYLGSIAYISPGQWAIWLNNKKYTTDKTQDDVNIVAVSPDNVRLVWAVDSLDVIVPDWRSKLIMNSSGNYVSSDNLVEVNNAGSKITFMLRPNQSFISSRMKVVEGQSSGAFSLSF